MQIKISEKMKTKSFATAEQVYQPSQKTLERMAQMDANTTEGGKKILQAFQNLR
tara:strand:- start:10915 stop:11076 length:162 start_codon:yes stop_codon:yes gene_type:complete